MSPEMSAGGGGAARGTTFAKLFVGGLAWETREETVRGHFEKYGEILEAVVITDRATGKSKGYGFVTFKDAEAAQQACEDASPIINGRRANCNLASLRARRHRSLPPLHPPQQVSRALPVMLPSYHPAYCPTSHFHDPLRLVPYPAYGYSLSYGADVRYSPNVAHAGVVAPTLPLYPCYHIQPHADGFPTNTYRSPSSLSLVISQVPSDATTGKVGLEN